jgi:molecular chaperone GrpE (heat shock protein)
MAFLDFFWKKMKYYAETSAQSVVSGINTQFAAHFADTNERLRRIENRQKEASIQLEEIDDFIQSGGNESALIEAIIALADTIGDFYFFAAADDGSPLFEQAQMMWSKVKNAAGAAGIEIIDPCNEPFDFRLHSAEGAEQDIDIENGYVIKTLKCGYMYRDKIVRRAVVIINKIEKVDSESEAPNIIYL